MALLADRLLARRARSHFGNRDPFSGMVSKERVLSACPEASSTRLAGGAFWKEGWMEAPQRLLMEVLRSATARGAAALNYVAAEKLVENGEEVRGIEARDAESGEILRFEAPVVVNATGPWAQDLASDFGYATAVPFHPSAAWNMLVRREPRSTYSLAVAAPASGPFLFLNPWGRHTLIGTGHAARAPSPAGKSGDLLDAHPTAAETVKFLASVNAAMPGLKLEREDVLRVFSGYLPADGPQSTGLRKRALIVRHGSHRKGGFYSVSGVKYTEAHEVAVRVLDRAFPATAGSVDPTRTFREPDLVPNGPGGKADADTEPADAFLRDREWMRRIIDREAVRHLDDLIFRRTTCGDDPEFARRIAPHVIELFDWDAGRRKRELTRVERICQQVGLIG
jgi:glycerol-3-phosphate dehydrogenase